MAELRNNNGLSFWQDEELLPFSHGFFTRLGGVSKGEIAGLNCGWGAKDPSDNVEENRKRVALSLGAIRPPQTLLQVHSPDVVILEGPLKEPTRGDAIVTKTHDLPIGVLTADCAPVLFADHKNGVIGAAHAGWRGAIGGVLSNTVEAMVGLGAEHVHIRAVVGPCIAQRNYEVGAEFVDEFLVEDHNYGQYFSGSDSIHFNLPRFVLDRLRDAGVDHCDWVGACTYDDDHKYYSFRRATHRKEADYGRLLSSIVLPI